MDIFVAVPTFLKSRAVTVLKKNLRMPVRPFKIPNLVLQIKFSCGPIRPKSYFLRADSSWPVFFGWDESA